MQQQTVAELHAMVWDWRLRNSFWFPTPPPRDSLLFAVTEAAEAVDAHLRQNESYRRRSAKEHEEEREWVQCALMLLTAIPEWHLVHEDWKTYAVPVDIEPLVFYTAMALWHLDGNGRELCAAVVYAIGVYLQEMFVVDLPTAMQAELQRLMSFREEMPSSTPAPYREVCTQ